MIDITKHLADWPLMKNGQPLLKTIDEAFLYAQLICNRQDKQKQLAICRRGIYMALYQERNKKDPNLQIMMDLAVRAQFYRECLEEVQRIVDEHFTY